MCTAKKILTPMLSPYILETKRDIANFFWDLKSLRSDNFVVEFWRKSETVDFFS